MTDHRQTTLALLAEGGDDFLRDWIAEAGGADAAADGHRAREARTVLAALRSAVQGGARGDTLEDAAWLPARQALASLSGARAAAGESAADTSRFVLALKRPLFNSILRRHGDDPAGLSDALWSATTLVDRLAQFTVSTFQQAREDIIRRQQDELLELSTPVVKLWDGVLAVPMIGTLDSARTSLVMETLLQRIVETGAELAIIDITGVPTVDTLVAQHLLKTVSAIRLMGADCIISGIRPQIAQTIVHLGIELEGIMTKATLADALALALKRTGHTVTRALA